MLSENGQKVFEARYAARDEQGKICESFEQAVQRLARTAAAREKDPEEWEKKFREAISSLFFVPSTPIWANIGKTDRPWQPGACFVLDVEDSLQSMYETLTKTALVFKSGGGVGYNFSKIRPQGSLVNSTKGQASGVVELIKLYDASSNMVMQGGVRRGASMGILNVDHPEILSFIHSKLHGGMVNFNISVGITDAFMQAVADNQEWNLIFQDQIKQTCEAREIWQDIAQAAYSCGDPGLVFLDRIQRDNPIPGNFLNCTNPCGEQPLSPGESCLLSSINLSLMVDEKGQLKKELLIDTVQTAVRFLDNLIDLAEYPLPEIAEATRASRKIGLGFTGLHDALIKSGLAYDSEAGRKKAGEITALIQQTAHQTSEALGEEKGVFPLWEKSIFYPEIKRRNAACITIAPTGSVTAMAGCESYGIEPIFAVAYSKKTNVAGEFAVFSPLFQKACQEAGVSQIAMQETARRGSCQGVAGIPAEIQAIFKGAQDIDFLDHIKMQAEVQKYVENAVSKTINMNGEATLEDVIKAYQLAYDLGLKGITIFRDGCKTGTITVGENKEAEVREKAELKRGEIKPRPVSAHGVTHRIDTGCGKIYLTVNYQGSEILETFITTGSDGGCLVYSEAASRLISLGLRGGIPLEKITEQLMGTHACPSYMRAKGSGKNLSPGKSCASAVAKKLTEIAWEIRHNQNEIGKPAATDLEIEEQGICDLCGEPLKLAEGCFVCLNCGNSRC